MDADTFSAEVERALRRVRSTSDLDDLHIPSRPTRHPRGMQRRSESQWSQRATTYQARHARGVDPTDVRRAFPQIERPQEAAIRLARAPHPSEAWDINFRFPEEPRQDAGTPANNTRPPPRGWVGKVMVFFGQAGPDARVRSQLISVVWSLSFGLAQFIVIVAMLAYSANRESPTMPGKSEWDACQRPLGAWNALWLGRVVLGCLLAYWTWRRERTVRLAQDRRQSGSDIEGSNFGLDSSTTRPVNTFHNNIRRNRPQPVPPPAPTTAELLQRLPYTHLYSRLNVLVSALSLVWFLTAHILEYTSVNTCRFAAPHLWWLTFGILCILYMMILEIFLLGLLVFILGPVLYLVWNIVLLCLGRHPIQNPHYIKPEIGKLSKSIVDQIPLVLYIPPPPETDDSKEKNRSPITVPSSVYHYPPKPAGQDLRKRRFAFLRRSKKTNGRNNGDNSSEKGKGKEHGDIKTWEDHWVSGEYPFVRLEGNRAACAICLMDFEEPEKVDAEKSAKVDGAAVAGGGDGVGVGAGAGDVQEVQVDEVTAEDHERLKLEDAGEGAQPLRLLGCGHVFHKTCLDPWLTDVSGRCPVCQRAVEIPEPPDKRKKERRNRRTPPTS